jgi:hypothetical protein
MSEKRTIDCPRCNEPVAYSSNEEGKVGECPYCQEKIWYSKLVHPAHEEKGSEPAPQSDPAPGNKTTSSGNPVIWCIIAFLGCYIVFDNYRLRSEARVLGQEIRALHKEQPGNHQATGLQPTALAKAELNQAQLDAIVSEVNAIETVIESKLSQFTNRSTEDANKIETFADNLETVMEEFERLELSISEIQDAMNAMMDNYSRLEDELSNRR